MQYRLMTQPTTGPGKVTEELERLLKNAKRLTTSIVVIGPPHKQIPMTATVLEVPDQFALMATKVLEVILGTSGRYDPQQAIPLRKEWQRHALLLPMKGAQPLVESLFDGWESVGVDLHWAPGRCAGVIHYSVGDAARVATLAGYHWKVVPIPTKVAQTLSRVVLLPVQHQPFVGRPIVTPQADLASMPAAAHAATSARTIFSDPQESVFDLVPGVAARRPAPSAPSAIGTILAPSGGAGLSLGTTLDGQAVRLTWCALRLAVIAPEDRQRDLVTAMIGRAIQHDMGLIAVVPRALVGGRALQAWTARIRALDGRDLWQSMAIPWHQIAPALLRQALAAAQITPQLPDTLPRTFGELLQELPGGERYCTEAVLALTAPEGDDLRGIISAGGGVVLIDEADPGSRLLGMLLLALIADPPIDRRMLVIRPPQIPAPASLADRVIQIVLGEDALALGILRANKDSWQLTHADGSPPVELDADLERPPSALDETSYGTLIGTLTGTAAAPAATGDLAGGAWGDLGGGIAGSTLADDVDPFDRPFAAPVAASFPVLSGDDLFSGMPATVDSPFAVPDSLAPAARVTAGTSDNAMAPSTIGGLFDFALAPPFGTADVAQPAPAQDGLWVAPFNTSLVVAGERPTDASAHDADALWAAPLPDSALGYDLFATPLYGAPNATATTNEPDTIFPWFGTQDAVLEEPDDLPAAAASESVTDGLFAMPTAPTHMNWATPLLDAGLGYDPFAVPLHDLPSGDGTQAAGMFPMLPPTADEVSLHEGANGAEAAWPLDTALEGTPLAIEPSDGALAPTADLWELPPIETDGASTRVSDFLAAELPAPQEAMIVPADYAGWPSDTAAITIWATTPSIDAPLAAPDTPHDTLAGAPAVIMDAESLVVPQAAGALPWPHAEPIAMDSAAEAAAPFADVSLETTTASIRPVRHVAVVRRRRAWQPRGQSSTDGALAGEAMPATAVAATHTVVAPPAQDATADLDTALPEPLDGEQLPGGADLNEEADGLDGEELPVDELTLALVDGDLDLTCVPAFDGLEFRLSPLTLDAPADEAATMDTSIVAVPLRTDEPAALESHPVLSVNLDLPVGPADPAVATITSGAAASLTPQTQTAPGVDETPVPDATPFVLPLTIKESTPDAALAALPDCQAPATAPITLSAATVPQTPASWDAPAGLVMDADTVTMAWRAGTGLPALIDLVTHDNPTIDRSTIRRAIRALLDSRAADRAAPLLSTASSVAMGSVAMPAAAPPLITLYPAARDSHALVSAPAPTADAGMTFLPEDGPTTVDQPFSPTPLAVDPEGAGADGAPVLEAGQVATQDPAVPPTLDTDLIWTRWMRDDDLADIIRDLCGYTRGKLADTTRDQVYSVVVPRIVAELGAEAVVARLLSGRQPLQSQLSLYETLLRRMNRQAGPVTGVIREKTTARLVTTMREVTPPASRPA